MKKIVLLLFVVFTSLSSSAQYWYQYKTEADELKGTQANSYHAVKIPEKGIVTLDDNNDVFTFVTFEGMFNYESYQRVFTIVEGLFGMYGENGELIGKETVMLGVSRESPDFAIADYSRNYPGKEKNAASIKRVATWVRGNKGSVRFVIPRYGRADFDITLPTMLSHKEPSRNKPKGTSRNMGTIKKK